MFLQIFAILFFWALPSTLLARNAEPAKTFVVDLDLSPMQRWEKVVEAADIAYMKHGIDQLLKNALPSEHLVKLAEAIAGDLERFIPQPYADEIRGLSKLSGIPLGDIAIINVIYDISAFGSSSNKACTSIVTSDHNGVVYHGRNLDYYQPSFLKNLTIQADFRRSGKTLFMATTYMGYIGVITGCRNGAFSISGDERDVGEWWENLLALAEGSQLTFFHERRMLENCETYKDALVEAVQKPTIAPVYYIIGGMNPHEGAIVVRNAHSLANVSYIGMDVTHPWYLVETNYDPWKTPPSSDDRRDAAIRAMNKVGHAMMNGDMLYKVLSSPLVFNNQTSYTTIMSASNASVYHTMVRWDGPAP